MHDLREIVNATLYVNRTGIPWEYSPHDFPPCKTVYDYYVKWEADGTTQQVHDLLRDKAHRAHGRNSEPTAVAVDAQSVKTSANVPETSQGINAGKKIKGRKRHLITDTLGLVLAVDVTAASVHDTVGGKLSDFSGQGGSSGLISAHKVPSTPHGRVPTPHERPDHHTGHARPAPTLTGCPAIVPQQPATRARS